MPGTSILLTTVHLRTLITSRYKLTVYRNAPYGELFHLAVDPEKWHNVDVLIEAWQDFRG
jgi:hypothetical protein